MPKGRAQRILPKSGRCGAQSSYVPLFFFHIRTSDGVIEDEDGVELPNIEVAREEALESAREIMAEKLRDDETIDHLEAYEIADETGETLVKVLFADAITRM